MDPAFGSFEFACGLPVHLPDEPAAAEPLPPAIAETRDADTEREACIKIVLAQRWPDSPACDRVKLAIIDAITARRPT